jgi:hypothetical protein
VYQYRGIKKGENVVVKVRRHTDRQIGFDGICCECSCWNRSSRHIFQRALVFSVLILLLEEENPIVVIGLQVSTMPRPDAHIMLQVQRVEGCWQSL